MIRSFINITLPLLYDRVPFIDLHSAIHFFLPNYSLKFIYSEKATNFCKNSTVDLSYVVTVKSTVEISQNSVAFSEYMNFTQ